MRHLSNVIPLKAFRICPALAAAALLTATVAKVHADVLENFATNPLTQPGVLIQGPDAANAATRFTYDGTADTLTAHYDTTAPTIKLLFPLGQHLTQDDSFSVTTRIEIQSNGFVNPAEFGAEAPSFGLVNSTSTGDLRASTGFFDSDFTFHQVTPGTTYNILTWDYFPTADQTFGGSDVSLSSVGAAQPSGQFDDSFGPGAFATQTLPIDQFFNAGFTYDSTTHMATLSWGSGSVTASMNGAQFDVDSFGITLWRDPNIAPPLPAQSSSDPLAANVVFDSIAVDVVPEPATFATLAVLPLLLLRRRRRN